MSSAKDVFERLAEREKQIKKNECKRLVSLLYDVLEASSNHDPEYRRGIEQAIAIIWKEAN